MKEFLLNKWSKLSSHKQLTFISTAIFVLGSFILITVWKGFVVAATALLSLSLVVAFIIAAYGWVTWDLYD